MITTILNYLHIGSNMHLFSSKKIEKKN